MAESCVSRKTKMSRILGLRAKAPAARYRGNKLPFDKVYLVKREDEGLIPRMLPVCMRLKLSSYLADALGALVCDVLQSAGSDHAATGAPLSKEALPDSMVLAKEFQADLLAGAGALNKWWLVVPMLLGTAKENPDNEIQYNSRVLYLRNRSWQAPRTFGLTTVAAIPDASALLVYGEEITPPCMACPKLISHMTGGCVLGEPECLENMGLVHRSQYKKNIAKYRKEVDASASILADDPDGAGDQGA